jgi:uncharacterized protein (TIGR03437 family)
MLRTSAFFLLCFSSLGLAQTPQLTIVSAASDAANLSPESLASAFGSNLASDTAAAQDLPWPASLGGVTVQVKDSAGTSRPAGLLFVSPGQINFQIPTGTALGPAIVSVKTGSVTLTAQVPITRVAPALFAIDAAGLAAATAIRVPIATEFAAPLALFDCSSGPANCSLIPIRLGADAMVYVSLYGTGIHGYAQKTPIRVDIGDDTVYAMYAGPQGQFPGLDQVNIALPLTLRGAGTVDVTVTVDGMTSNPVKLGVH